MAVALGLLAAVLWGCTDFLIRMSSRRHGIPRSVIYAQASSLAAVGCWIVLDPYTRGLMYGASRLAWSAAFGAGFVGLLATLAVYRAFQIGRIGVVSPVASAYGAVSAIIAILTGEHLGTAILVGITMVVGGVIFVATPVSNDDAAKARVGRQSSGLMWAVIACVGYGSCYWIQGRFAVPEMGPVLPVGAFYLVSTTFLAATALIRRPPLAVSWREARALVGTGLVAVLGFLALCAGFATGAVAVVTVISSLQSPVTVGLAALFLRERLVARQWIGVVAIVAGLGLIRA